MATYYIDLEGGNDSNDGLSFANRWKTCQLGATAARLLPGDTIRLMASPDETLVGDCSWTQGSKTVTLPAPVTAVISNCETAWTGSANVTQTADATLYKEGSKSAKSVIASAFTTGKVAYVATGTLDLSSYQQVSFWIHNTLVAIAANTLSLRLCSDTTGDVTVNTIPIPSIASTGLWVPVTVNLGTNLGASIASVALYADLDPANPNIYLDNIIACKAASSADSLSLTSLLGKAAATCWKPSTAYAANAVRKPTQPNRNGYRYQVLSGGGTSGSSEPSWPAEIGATVQDGGLTWQCIGLEETWWAIQSINGTTVLLDNLTSTLGSAGRGYDGATETVATYKRETIKPFAIGAAATNVAMKAGDPSGVITYIGGWDRTNMSAMTGETWTSGHNGGSNNYGFAMSGKSYVRLINLNVSRYSSGFVIDGPRGSSVINCHASNCTNGLMQQTGHSGTQMIGLSLRANSYGWYCSGASTQMSAQLYAVTAASNINHGIHDASFSALRLQNVEAQNNGLYGLSPAALTWTGYNVVTANNGSGAINPVSVAREHLFHNCRFSEGVAAPNAMLGRRICSNHDGQVKNAHLITLDGGTIASDAVVRFGASGYSWRFRPTATNRDLLYPLSLPIATLAVNAGSAVTLNVKTRRDSTSIKGRLLLRGSQIAGVPDDVVVVCEPVIDSWVQSGDLTFTPTASGVVEVLFLVADGVNTGNSFWIDMLTVSQA